MFSIGFLELVVVGVVSLVVLGPERLPGAIRTASLWIGRLRRSFNNIKQDIEKEIGADEIRRQLRNEAIMDKFKQTKTQVTDTLNTVKKETDAFRKNVELEARAAGLSSQSSAPTADSLIKPAADKPAAGATAAGSSQGDTATATDGAASDAASEAASNPPPSAAQTSSAASPASTVDAPAATPTASPVRPAPATASTAGARPEPPLQDASAHPENIHSKADS